MSRTSLFSFYRFFTHSFDKCSSSEKSSSGNGPTSNIWHRGGRSIKTLLYSSPYPSIFVPLLQGRFRILQKYSFWVCFWQTKRVMIPTFKIAHRYSVTGLLNDFCCKPGIVARIWLSCVSFPVITASDQIDRFVPRNSFV